jgi:multidrug efflux pump subunit AcrA (membrane-fusion protein)
MGFLVLFLPWTQNIRGYGKVTTLTPEDRPQTLQSRIDGRIERWYVQEGDTVKKGQLLAKIYADIYSIQRDQAASGVEQSKAQVANSQSALNALKAQLEQAQRNFDMQKKLFDEKVISLSEFNVADASLKSAKANYNAAIQGIRGGSAAVQAALSNQLQRSVNILLGSVLATIGLTIPAALAIGLFTGREVMLGLRPAEITLLFVTLSVSMLTFGQGRTNMLQGAIHLLVFGVYLFLIFD